MEPNLDMQQIMAAAQQMQQQLVSTQQRLADETVTGTAGGGLVTATVTGQGELSDLRIDPAAISGEDPAEAAQTIADLVLAAVRSAVAAAEEMQQRQLGPFAAALSGALPGGMDLPGGLDLSGLGLAGGTDGPDSGEDQET